MLKIFMYKNGTGTAEIFDADNIPKTGYSDNPKTAMVGKGTTKAAVADDPSTPDVNEAFEQ